MNIMNDIRKKFNNVLKANVFYNMSLIKLKHIANNYKEDSEDLNHYINNLKIDNLSKYMLLEVVTLAEGRFEYVIPSQKLSESILFFVVLFLTKPREDVTNEKKLLLNPLIMNNRCNENGGVIDSARLSFLILHLLYFILNITLHFLIIIVFLQNFENLDRDEIEMLLIHKEDVRTLKAGNLKDYLAEKLTSMNSKLNGPDAILDICLPYVLHPIKSRKLICFNII